MSKHSSTLVASVPWCSFMQTPTLLSSKVLQSVIGLVYDATVSYRKTAIINRAIRTLEDVTRCCLVQVGNFNELWPLAVRYAATASTISNWNKLYVYGHDFEGLQIPFGAFIHYKPGVPKTKLGAKTLAGLFLGWRVEAGIQWKRAYLVCDVASFQVLTSMVVEQTGADKFPLREAVKTKLESLESLPVLRLEDGVRALEEDVIHEEIGPLEEDVFLDNPVGESERNLQSTSPSLFPDWCSLVLVQVAQPTCENGGGEHTSSCRERFDKLIRGASSHFPRALQRALTHGSLKKISSVDFTTSNARSSSIPCCQMIFLWTPSDLEQKPPKLNTSRTGMKETVLTRIGEVTTKLWKIFALEKQSFNFCLKTMRLQAELLKLSDGEQLALPRPIQGGKNGKRTAQHRSSCQHTIRWLNFVAVPNPILGKFWNPQVWSTSVLPKPMGMSQSLKCNLNFWKF